jgi:hypothetical protein
MHVDELKKELEKMDDNAVVLFESRDGAGPADASFSIDEVRSNNGGFVILVSHD